MNILHVSSYPPWKGGIADYMAMLHTAMGEESTDTHEVLALTEAGGDNVHGVLEKEDRMSFVKGFQHVRDSSPDVLHIQHELNLYGRINFLIFAFLLLLWKPFTSTSFVTTLHTYENIPLKLTPKGILRFIGYRIVTYNLIYLLSDRIIVHNDVLAERMDRDDVTVIPHGVKTINDAEDVRQEYGFNSDDIFLLCMGFLSDGKGFDYAIEALKDLPEDYKLLVIGSPPPNFEEAGEQYYRQLQDLVKQEGLGDRVELRKRFIEEDEIDNLIHSCDIMLFPYRGSSQSGMMHRAIGAGADIICSDLDVFQAVLGDAGTYFQQGNPSTLAQTIKAFEPNKGAIDDLRERMKWSSIAEKHMELYRSLKA
jgi:glycosyltransferase involved in cell wall biosynthesis